MTNFLDLTCWCVASLKEHSKLPVSRRLVPVMSWRPSLIHPFEPKEGALKCVSLRTGLLLAFTTAKRVSDLCVLFSSACLQWASELSMVCLRPNPPFVSNMMDSLLRYCLLELLALHSSPFSSKEDYPVQTFTNDGSMLLVSASQTTGLFREQHFIKTNQWLAHRTVEIKGLC